MNKDYKFKEEMKREGQTFKSDSKIDLDELNEDYLLKYEDYIDQLSDRLDWESIQNAETKLYWEHKDYLKRVKMPKVEEEKIMYLVLKKLHDKWFLPLKGFSYSSIDNKVEPLRWLARAFTDYTASDLQYNLLCSGLEGLGKSSVSILIGYFLKFNGMKFDLLRNVFYRSTPFEYVVDRIQSTRKNVFIFDEAREQFYKRNAMYGSQKELLESLVMQRSHNHIYIFCIAELDELDYDLRKRIINGLIPIIDRNFCSFMFRQPVTASADPFKISELNDRLSQMNITDMRKVMEIYATHSATYCSFRTPLLPMPIYNGYKYLKENLNKMENQFFQGNTITILRELIKNKTALKAVSESLGVSKTTIKEIMKKELEKN